MSAESMCALVKSSLAELDILEYLSCLEHRQWFPCSSTEVRSQLALQHRERERERQSERENMKLVQTKSFCVSCSCSRVEFLVPTGSRRHSRHEGSICAAHTTHVAVPERLYGYDSSICVRTIDTGDGIERVRLQIVTFD